MNKTDTIITFKKNYDGESIVDLFRDIGESFDSRFNLTMIKIPVDDYGFQRGTFTVKIEWRNE